MLHLIVQSREKIDSFKWPHGMTPTAEQQTSQAGFIAASRTYLDYIETLPPNNKLEATIHAFDQTWAKGCECIEAGGGATTGHAHGGGGASG